MDTQTALDAVKASTTVAKECLDAGMYLGKKCFKELAIFIELGLVVRTVIGFTEPGQKDPVLKEIGELSDKLDKIEEKMKENFDDLKAFVSQYSFYNDVPLVGAILSQYMRYATNDPSDVTRDKFQDKYEMYSPLEYARRLRHQLSKTTTNPLRMLMIANPLKGKETFKKWRDNYESVLAQLAIVEATACKLFNDGDQHDIELLKEEFEYFEKCADRWQEEYENDDHYWPDAVKKVVEEIQDNNKDKTSDQVAELIHQKLNTILTSDILSILVFRVGYRKTDHCNLPTHVISSPNRGDCHVYIHRTKKADATAEKLEQFRKKMEVQQKMGRTHTGSFPSELKTIPAALQDSGLIVLIENGEYVGMRSTKTDQFPNGVACHFKGTMEGQLRYRFRDADIPFFFYAVYQ